MDGHLGHGSAGVATAAGLWFAMTLVMMAPVVAPWVRAYATLVAPVPNTRAWSATLPFVAGYALVWAAFALVMALLQLALASTGALAGDRLAGLAGSAVLVGAGLFQFAPVKRACLTHCRNPLSYFLVRWRNGPPSGVRLGLGHGLFCLGCCWALMLASFALGTMHLGWMAALTAVMALEQAAPWGAALGRAFGAGLVALGVWRLVLEG